MSGRELRGRCLLVACFIGGVLLTLFGLYRWPPQIVSHPTRLPDPAIGTRSSFARKPSVEERHVFIADRSRFDVGVGLADYAASAALFVLGVLFWLRSIPKWRGRRAGIPVLRGGEALVVVFILLNLIGGVFASLIALGAFVSVIQA